MKQILVTGCSSGFGLEIARHFLERDWSVIATMRRPDPDVLPHAPGLRIVPLDVTDPASIEAALAAAGPIDALVNNAGIGMLAPLEATSMRIAREVFETNTLGTIAMTQAVLPAFRARRSGVIVNVTSTVTVKSLPLLSVYSASKAAVNAFTESLALEVEQFGLRVRLVLPGRSPTTRFGENARPRMQSGSAPAYDALVQSVVARVSDRTSLVTHAQDVAQAVWRAVTDASAPMRIAAGADAVEWMKAG